MALTAISKLADYPVPIWDPSGVPAAVPEAGNSLVAEVVVPIDLVRYELVATFHSDSKKGDTDQTIPRRYQ